MAGELWQSTTQIGKEITAGTAVAATRKLYLDNPILTRSRAPRPHMFATGTRDNQRAFTSGPPVVGGSFRMPLSAEEIIEWLLVGIKGAVTPSTPSAGVSLWTFVPGALDSATLEWHDGARAWQEAGVRANRLAISGSVEGPNELSVDLFGTALVANALTGSLADRAPSFLEGWETKIYVDAFGGTPGTTVLPATLISWTVTVDNGLGRKYFADNLNAAGAVVTGLLKVTAELVLEAAPSTTLTEYTNWDAVTKRLIRLEFGQNSVISLTFKRFITVDLPGAWSAVDLGQSNLGTRVYRFSYEYVYDPTLAAGIQVRAQNARATAW